MSGGAEIVRAPKRDERPRMTIFATSERNGLHFARCLENFCKVVLSSDIGREHLALLMAEHAAAHDRGGRRESYGR